MNRTSISIAAAIGLTAAALADWWTDRGPITDSGCGVEPTGGGR